MTRIEKIGDCTLYLADCMDVLPTLGKVDAVVTDPPYEIKTGFGSSSLDGNRRMEFDFDVDGVTDSVVLPAMSQCFRSCNSFHSFCGFEQYRLLAIAARENGLIPKPFCVVKECPPPPMPGTWWPSGFELAMYGYRPGKSWFGEAENKKRCNVFSADSYRHGIRRTEKENHPTQKWLPLIHRITSALVPFQGICLDPFMGSGTTGVACAKMGRKFIGIEISEEYFEIACNRIRAAYAQPDMFLENA